MKRVSYSVETKYKAVEMKAAGFSTKEIMKELIKIFHYFVRLFNKNSWKNAELVNDLECILYRKRILIFGVIT